MNASRRATARDRPASRKDAEDDFYGRYRCEQPTMRLDDPELPPNLQSGILMLGKAVCWSTFQDDRHRSCTQVRALTANKCYDTVMNALKDLESLKGYYYCRNHGAEDAERLWTATVRIVKDKHFGDLMLRNGVRIRQSFVWKFLLAGVVTLGLVDGDVQDVLEAINTVPHEMVQVLRLHIEMPGIPNRPALQLCLFRGAYYFAVTWAKRRFKHDVRYAFEEHEKVLHTSVDHLLEQSTSAVGRGERTGCASAHKSSKNALITEILLDGTKRIAFALGRADSLLVKTNENPSLRATGALTSTARIEGNAVKYEHGD